MKKIDLTALSSKQLERLLAQVNSEIAVRQQKEKDIEELRQLASSKGIKIQELVTELGGTAKPKASKPRGSVPVKFRHPQNPELTWTGRGKKPIWLREALNEGLSMEALAA